jgi:hypothetical protein
VEVKESKCGIESKCVLVAPGHLSFNGIKSMYVAQAYVSSTGVIQKNLHVECDM